MYEIEPWGDDWLQTGILAAEVHNQGQLNCAISAASRGVEVKPTHRQPAHYIPGAKPVKRRRKRGLSAAESEARAARRHK